MKQIILILIFLFCSSPLLAKVEVLCLGEGECLDINSNPNAVHPGSMSGASDIERLEYFNWLKDQAGPYGIIIPDLGFGGSDSLSESDSNQLDNAIADLFDQLKVVKSECEINSLSSEGCEGYDSGLAEECIEDALSSDSCLEEYRIPALALCVSSGHLSSINCDDNAAAVDFCETEPLDHLELDCEKYFPEEYQRAQCDRNHQYHPECDEYLEAQAELDIDVISPVVYVGSVTPLDSVFISTGGSGVGPISYSTEYSAEGAECVIGETEEGETLTVPREIGICTIIVSKAEDTDYLVAHSTPIDITVEERDEIVAFCEGIEFVSGQDTLISLDDFDLQEPFTVLSEEEWQQRHLVEDDTRDDNCKRAGHEEWALTYGSPQITKTCSFDRDILHATVSLDASDTCHYSERSRCEREQIEFSTQFQAGTRYSFSNVQKTFPWRHEKARGRDKGHAWPQTRPSCAEGTCVSPRYTLTKSFDFENADFTKQDKMPGTPTWMTSKEIPQWAFEVGVRHMRMMIHGRDNQRDGTSCLFGVFYDGVVVNIQFRDQEPLLGQE